MSEPKFKTFFDLYAEGNALAVEIDDYIDKWHDSSDEVDCELHEYLGLTEEEYSAFMSDDEEVLPLILKARQERQPLENVIEFAVNNESLAARAQDTAALRNWLKSRKRSQG